jgi:hypothetical protein
LALLKRSDVDYVLPVACDYPETLAADLSVMQPFEVQVCAVWPGRAGRLPFVYQALWPMRVGNGWFHIAAPLAAEAMDDACAPNCPTQPPPSPEPTTGTDSGSDGPAKAGKAKKKPHIPIPVDPAWHTLLQECPRAQADKTTVIRKALKRMLGPVEAAALLSHYKEGALRVATGGCQRFVTNDKGVTMKLADNTVATKT